MKRIKRMLGIYTTKDLTAFGNYLLKTKKNADERCKDCVCHSDFSNWKEQ